MKNEQARLFRALKKHSFGSVFMRNLLLLTCLIMVPMLLVVWITTLSLRTFAEKEITLYSSRTISLLQSSVDQMVGDCLQQANFLLGENDINLFLITPSNSYTFYHNDVIYKLLQTQLQTRDYLESVYIYSDVSQRLVSNYGETTLDRFFDTGWLDYYEDYKGDNSFFYHFRDGVTKFLKPIKVLSLYKVLSHADGRKGVIVYNVNFDKFTRVLETMRNEHDIGLSLRYLDGELVQLVWGDADPGPVLELAAGNESGHWQKGGRIVYKSPVQYTDLYLYSTIHSGAIQQSLREPQQTMVLIIAGGFVLVLALTVAISARIYRPFRKIIDELNTPAGLMTGQVNISGDEEEYVLSSIRGMFHENEQIARELANRVALLKQAQSVALQSQINPHFLHNTLDSISWATMRLTGGKNEASVMLTKLGQMLRYSLDDVDTLVPFRKELENTRQYLELQELRYKNSFQVQWDIQQDILEGKVIKLMLQPIVENAIQHGLKPRGKDGVIRISARESGGILKIGIWDNGEGIPPERMETIEAMLRSDMIQERESIGILNVHQRIQLFYGEKYGVDVRVEEGTLVTLHLPFTRS